MLAEKCLSWQYIKVKSFSMKINTMDLRSLHFLVGKRVINTLTAYGHSPFLFAKIKLRGLYFKFWWIYNMFFDRT
jgi:hypothetical protein